jgi:hypothetical protein
MNLNDCHRQRTKRSTEQKAMMKSQHFQLSFNRNTVENRLATEKPEHQKTEDGESIPNGHAQRSSTNR